VASVMCTSCGSGYDPSAASSCPRCGSVGWVPASVGAPTGAHPQFTPGWYPDAAGPGQPLYWDGARWLAPVATTVPQTSGLAIGALIAALLAPVVGLVLGYYARREIARSNGALSGKGLTTAAIVLGWIGTVGAVLWIGFLIFLVSHSSLSATDSSFWGGGSTVASAEPSSTFTGDPDSFARVVSYFDGDQAQARDAVASSCNRVRSGEGWQDVVTSWRNSGATGAVEQMVNDALRAGCPERAH
jgi:hypothetical protein